MKGVDTSLFRLQHDNPVVTLAVQTTDCGVLWLGQQVCVEAVQCCVGPVPPVGVGLAGRAQSGLLLLPGLPRPGNGHRHRPPLRLHARHSRRQVANIHDQPGITCQTKSDNTCESLNKQQYLVTDCLP